MPPPLWVEQLDEHVGALSHALQGRDAGALQSAAASLLAVVTAAAAVKHAPHELSPAARRQLEQAAGRLGAEREALARAAASTHRALAVLLPSAMAAAGTYSAHGLPEPSGTAPGSAWA